MVIRIFKRNAPAIPIMILVMGMLLWADGFIFYKKAVPAIFDQGPFYNLIGGVNQIHPFFSRMLAFLLLVLQVFLLNNMVQANNLLGKPSWLPGFIYLLMMSSHPELLQLHPVLFANFFLMIALARTLVAYSEGAVMVEVFNVGFLVALAGLFYYPALLFFTWLILAMLVYFLMNIRGIAAALMGFLSPFFFLFTYYYLTDQLRVRIDEMINHFSPFQIFEHPLPVFSIVLAIALAAIALFAFLKVYLTYVNDKPVRLRKRFKVLGYFFLVSLTTFLVFNNNFEVHLAMVMIPLSVVFSLFLLELRKKWLAELWFYGFLFLIIAGKVLYWGY
ncbi:MAG: DUF6427 family protein [Bacteroides sp.]|jgi:hypothetical protein|nr:DUF6427 family protein [Bacteroides sp.]